MTEKEAVLEKEPKSKVSKEIKKTPVEKTFEELYGLPEINDSSSYEFEFIKKHKSPTYSIGAKCRIYDPVEKRQRAIRYIPTEDSIFEEEQEAVGNNKPIWFPHGKLIVSGKDKNLVRFLMLTDDNKDKKNRLKRDNGFIRLVDREAEAKTRLKMTEALTEASKVVSTAPLEDLLPYVAISGIDYVNPEKEESQIRIQLMIVARKNPQHFLDFYKDPKYERKFVIHKGFKQGIITSTHKKYAVHWKDNLVKILDYPPNETALNYLTDWSTGKEGEEFYGNLKRLVK